MTETSPDDVAEAQRWLGGADDELMIVMSRSTREA